LASGVSAHAGKPLTSKPAGAVIGSPSLTNRQIRERAYFIYLARGGIGGDPAGDWLRAERELRNELHNAASASR